MGHYVRTYGGDERICAHELAVLLKQLHQRRYERGMNTWPIRNVFPGKDKERKIRTRKTSHVIRWIGWRMESMRVSVHECKVICERVRCVAVELQDAFVCPCAGMYVRACAWVCVCMCMRVRVHACLRAYVCLRLCVVYVVFVRGVRAHACWVSDCVFLKSVLTQDRPAASE